MAKPTERQKEVISKIHQYMDYLATSNDIHSPSHEEDAWNLIEETEDGFDNPEKYDEVESAMVQLWHAIANLDKCHMREEMANKLKQ